MSEIRSEKFQIMDALLIDIKHFLKKLESSQLDIEAGQWELHKDIANVKKTVEELKKLKDDFEVMKMNNTEQMGLIKNLETKLELINKYCHRNEPENVSESTVEYETVYRRPADAQQPAKGYKKRKCHLVRSEEIIEITSELSDKRSESDNENSVSRGEKNTMEKSDNNVEVVSEDVKETQNNSQVCHQSHPTILQRYLKDSAMYRDRKSSYSSDMSGSFTDANLCGETKNSEYNFWDEYSSRCPKSQSYHNREQDTKKDSSGNTKTTESILPKRLICPKNLKKLNFKSDIPDRESRGRKAKYFYECGTCGKGFAKKDSLRAHEEIHLDERKSKGYKCSYCKKSFSTPENLTLHLRNCRIVTRLHYRRR